MQYQQTETRANRAGVIREINNIPAASKRKTPRAKLVYTPSEHNGQIVPSDQFQLAKEKIKRTMAKSELRSRSQCRLSSSKTERQLCSPSFLTLAVNKETKRDLVESSHTILRKEISIQNKIDEREKLIEFINNEQEKLGESRKAFDEDRESYERYLERLRIDVACIEDEVKGLVEIKEQKDFTIYKLNQTIHEIEVEKNKVEEQLEVYKDHK